MARSRLYLPAIYVLLCASLTWGSGSKYVGNFRGDLSVDQGNAVYRVPIEIPRGPNNILPSLNLVYNSGGGNGPLGQGWALDVLSTISRCAQTIAQDGQVRGIHYDADDRFCLDGQRLMAVKGRYGANRSEYRTEVDIYSKITVSGQNRSGPSSFRVWTKDGRILDYGILNHKASDIEHPRHQWNLVQVRDRSNNMMNVSYLGNTNFPSAIYYGTTTVRLNYETRPDMSITYFNGDVLMNVTERLASVEVLNPTPIRTYHFAYKEPGSGGSNQSLLASMEFCDADNTCLRPLLFDYGASEQPEEDFPSPSNTINDFGTGWSILENPRFLEDMNGDGFKDIVGFHKDCVKVALYDGRQAKFNESRCWVTAFGYTTGWRGANHPRYVVDVNGDGLPDVIGFFHDGVHLAINTGRFLEPPNLVLSAFGYTAGTWRTVQHLRLVTDVNGDGLADIVGFHYNGVEVALGKGRTFETATTWSGEFGFTIGAWRIENHPRFLKDVTGDGLPDIVGIDHTGVHVAVNTGSTFQQSTEWLKKFNYNAGWRTQHHPRYLEDINGDGLADVIGFFVDGVHVALSTGTSFTDPIKVVSDFGYTAGAYRVVNHPRLVADITGDGLPDVIGFHNDGIHASVNTGNGTFAEPSRWVEAFGYTTGTWRVASHPREVDDLNGDGIADIVGFANDGVYVSLNKNKQPRIHYITDGFGAQQGISYQSIPAAQVSGHYEKAENAQYPIQNRCLPITVVTEIENNKDTEASNTTKYMYGDLKIDVLGRGGLGFQWTKEEYHNHRSVMTEVYQSFPLTGKTRRTKHVVQQEGHEVAVAEAYMAYEILMNHSVHSVIPHTETIISRELDGNIISEIENSYEGTNGVGDPLEVISRTTGGGQIFAQRTSNIYRNIENKWLVGQLLSSEVTHECTCHAPVTRHTRFEYDADTGSLLSQTIEPDDELALTTEFTYDEFGNVISKTEIPVMNRGQFRKVTTTFDENGIYMRTSSNGKGHTETYDYDHTTGSLNSLEGANKLRTNWTYDLLGRKVGEQRSDGTSISWSYNWESSYPGFVYNIEMTSEGSPTKTRVYDALDRVVRERSMGFNLDDVYEDITYNKEGLVSKHSLPHFASDNPVWTTYTYDILGRIINKNVPGPSGSVAEHSTIYNGLFSKNIDPLGHGTQLEKDALSRLVRVADHLGGVVVYEYDSVGNLVKTTDTAGQSTVTEYDTLGHKTAVEEPNMGRWEYKHNAFGELIWQRDANENILQQEYDVLGRIIERTEPEGTTTWTYDSHTLGLGKLSAVEQPDYKRSWFYDKNGRESKHTTEIQGEAYDILSTYDDNGRISQQTFPNGVSIFREYTDQGYLTNVEMGQAKNSRTKRVWSALAYDSSGRIQKERHGNNQVTEYEYDSATHLVGVETHKDGADMVRNLRFTYDANDNLLSREDFQQDVSESFRYDNLDRLVQSTVSSDDRTYQWRQNWDYFGDGNIRFNDFYGLGPFIYHPTKPQAVVKAGTHSYAYDMNGNAIQKDGRKIDWTSYNKPKQFETNRGDILFRYGPDRSRYFRQSASGDTAIYLDKDYEVNTIRNRSSSKVFVYGAMGRLVAVVAKNMTTENTGISYVHTDNLGSVDTITNEQADVVERLSYSAFGNRRAGDWRDANVKARNSLRGYTGHEHLEDMGLIHMNGRVFDPSIGRFLSPDPHVQDLTNTQALNRYSYVLNNPLRHNDPTGFFFKKIKKFVKKYWKPVVGVAVSVATFGAATPFAAAAVGAVGFTGTAAAVATGALAGAAGGFAGGTFVSGNVKGGLKSATGGAVFGGIGGYFGSTWNVERVATQATAGGVVSELAGGKFKDGFVLVGVAASARYLYNTIVQYDVDASPGGPAKQKTLNQRPYEGRNNFGIQGKPPDPSWVDKDQFLGVNWGEGGGVSRLMNRIPGINTVAGLHDVFQVELDKVFFPGARDIFNVPGMLPAAAISYTALLDGPGIPALLIDESRDNR